MNAVTQQTASLFDREQFRMTRLQVFNWGTFSDLHDIPISEKGFLFVGRSGAGKSTLLDAFSALLVPPRWVDFNAAAREAERSGRDRSLVTYIRGAWAEQKDGDSGEIATRYLRPGTAWSALALTYRNALGQIVVLVRVFWLRGSANGSTDVRDHYLIFERAFDLKELEEFGRSNFDVRKLRHSFPEAFSRDQFRPYCERFSRLLGIESEMALRLLHKTQSAKNLGDLNAFLRDFMLDKPETFDVAERLVGEFGELNAAHQAVITAREQIETLKPARERHEQTLALAVKRNLLDELRAGVDSYREERRITLLAEHISTLEIELAGLAGEIGRRHETLNNHKALLEDLKQQHRDLGGDQIARWGAEKSSLEIQRDERVRKRGQAKVACEFLGWSLSDSPQRFAELLGMARDEVENWQHRGKENRDAQFDLAARQKEAEGNFTKTVNEVQALRRQPSNIPAEMLELRAGIARAIGVSDDALPFVGELLEVKPDEAPWQGAIERVLHGFALSLLVDERHYPALANHINNTHLGKRLVYYRSGRVESWQAKPIAMNSLVLKLNVKEGHWADWLHAELRQCFDYACVDSLQAFRNADRALTREGQVKHNKTRHEKDDRRAVDDRRNWVLGFDNREKLGLFERQAQELADLIEDIKRRLRHFAEQDENRAARAMQCQTLINLQWSEIDVAPLLDRIAAIDKQIREAQEGNAALHELSRRIGDQKALVDDADGELRKIQANWLSVSNQAEESRRRLDALRNDSAIVALTPDQRRGLDERFARLPVPVRLDNIDRLTTDVVKSLGKEVEALNAEIAEGEKFIESRFADFIRSWAAESDGLDATLPAAPDFFAKLVRLESDGLPAHEERFFELLRTQSHQNLAALSTYLNDARKAILERMDLVNESLSQVPFNQNGEQRTFLRIDASDRQLPEVKEFRQDIQQALSHAWSDDREFAESRFVALRRIVERLASQDTGERRWRDLVLDVRQHVEFIGREIDDEGVEVEIYRSGAGKSGGQRQKLATTCLAAALRYQLGGNDHGVPMYAPVVLDEAFDKADNEFTALAMNIFANFGFQMIVATPLKSVMTLEPFIGGACFVDISDRRVSGVLMIEYDIDRHRLRLPEQARKEPSLEVS
jgi:uncharacterized protein YPO0396